ncbi:uncharacterized protein BYT42DRAFT_552683 [Radiomyces spectabilis]|uniref:uncharacterized protein n=1 Tax=Radiomyces spectabilis TaxID=64574 RepID=UPI00221FEAF2|nr:uncharacterized protein BYT42DRAFT_552683 [Radiomyces spectabilis]KAI8393923.1 hypothetical protein BYT42DRAFT_552683 [Radiomyces spectabilis]
MNLSPEETAAFKQFLHQLVSSMPDTEPEALTDYVLTLLDNPMPRDELINLFNEELSIFLDNQTETTVQKIFEALDSKSYLQSNEPQPTPTSSEQKLTLSQPRPEPTVIAPKDSTVPDPKPTSSETRSTTTPAPTEDRFKVESDDEEDDDTNFKRRKGSLSATDSPSSVPAASTQPVPSTKRKYTNEEYDVTSNGENARYTKHIRYENGSSTSPSNQSLPPLPGHLRQRLGNRVESNASVPKQRCPDYDQKGYCLRGDFCPFDHGEDHIVQYVEEFPGAVGIPGSPGAAPPNFLPGQGNQGYGQEMYAGQNNGVPNPQWQGMSARGGGGPMRSMRGGRGRGGRLGGSAPYTTRYTRSSTRIAVENIPSDKCTIDAVTEYFQKFGNIVDISVQPEFSRALLQFERHSEALAAYQSPEVIFNNRFVKVYWQKVDNEKEEPRKRDTSPDPEAIKAKAEELARLREERRQKQNEQLQKVLELQKQKEQLLQRQIKEHKTLLEKLENSKNMNPKEREAILASLAKISDSIQHSKNASAQPAPVTKDGSDQNASSTPTTEPSQTTTTVPASTAAAETSSQPLSAADKKAELEKMKAKLATLEAAKKAAESGNFRGSYHGRGRGASWMRGRSFNLDNRTKPTDENAPNEETKPTIDEPHVDAFQTTEQVGKNEETVTETVEETS